MYFLDELNGKQLKKKTRVILNIFKESKILATNYMKTPYNN